MVIFPNSSEQVSSVIKIMNAENINYRVVGNCSNILFSDGMLDYVLIKTDRLNYLKIKSDYIESGSGNNLTKIAYSALKYNLSGMEKLCGIPGSVGGAVIMNAGAYGAQMEDIVETTEYVNSEGNICYVTGQDHKFGYRCSCFTDKDVVTKVILKLHKGIHEEISDEMAEIKAKRSSTQPLSMPSAGSVFKRPEGFFAGKLIEDCGLKGASVGDAYVSEKHAGFIVNHGNASSSDVKKLIEIIQRKVAEKYDVQLETEIKFF